jgi:hypothetical protein
MHRLPARRAGELGESWGIMTNILHVKGKRKWFFGFFRLFPAFLVCVHVCACLLSVFGTHPRERERAIVCVEQQKNMKNHIANVRDEEKESERLNTPTERDGWRLVVARGWRRAHVLVNARMQRRLTRARKGKSTLANIENPLLPLLCIMGQYV